MMQRDNIILYDWLTFSLSSESLHILLENAQLTDLDDMEGLLLFLGLSNLQWQDQLSSRLFYTYRASAGHISIHYSLDSDNRPGIHRGICVEMSGAGVREFEEFGSRSIEDLLQWVLECGGHVARLDVAYDDFEGFIDLERMSDQCRHFHFTSRLKACRWIGDCDDTDSGNVAITVTHGSRSSRLFIRCYDKRLERHALDVDHWVRLELQLRDDDAMGFIMNDSPIGVKFRGVLAHYLNYRDENPSDSNKRRWEVSRWWVSFLDDVSAISIYTRKDTEYNKDRLLNYVCNHNQASNLSAVLLLGVDGFMQALSAREKPLPDKYKRILQAELAGQNILDKLSKLRSDYKK